MKRTIRLPLNALLLALVLVSVTTHAEDISGVWYGVAVDTLGDPNYDHQTVLAIAASPQTSASKVTYIYPAMGVTCRSDLIFNNVQTIGALPNVKRVWTFDDETQTGCDKGTVRVTASLNIYGQLNSIYFEWIYINGQVLNVGTLERVDLPLP